MQAGRLRRRVTIQQPVDTQNEIGEPITVWRTFAENVPAAIEPLSGREYFAAQQEQGDVSTRIRIRWRPGVTEVMRVTHTVKTNTSPEETQVDVYDIEAVLPDQRTGRRELHLMCKKRSADGFQSDGLQDG